MKRDPDLIRRICFAIEELPSQQQLTGLDDVNQAEFAHNAELMDDAGLIEAKFLRTNMATHVHIRRLTWAGHDFTDAARSDTLWRKAKESVIKPGASWTFDLLKEWLKAEIKNGFPTLR